MKRVLVLLSVLIFSSACMYEDVDDSLSNENLLKKDSELFKLLIKVSNEFDDPTEDISCIDFVYPFKILKYDNDFNIIGDVIMYNDTQLSNFLGSITNSQLISISYPISTTLANGTTFSVNNNVELKIAVDDCAGDEILTYCNGIFCPPVASECVWFVPFLNEKDNKYASGVFKSNNDGTVNFNFNNQDYTGTWTILYVNSEAHINLSLENNNPVGQDWRFDTKFQYENGYLKLDKAGTTYYLEKKCSSTTIYNVGDTGPAGGIIAHKKSSFSNGWQYIEVASNDLNPAEWGCISTSVATANNNNVGKGFLNSAQNMNYHTGLNNYFLNPSVCSSLNNGTLGVKNSLLLIQNNKIDWFLPSNEELLLLYNSLHLQGLGSFTNANYWSSTQVNITDAKTINFTTGTEENKPKNTTCKVRAIRYF